MQVSSLILLISQKIHETVTHMAFLWLIIIYQFVNLMIYVYTALLSHLQLLFYNIKLKIKSYVKYNCNALTVPCEKFKIVPFTSLRIKMIFIIFMTLQTFSIAFVSTLSVCYFFKAQFSLRCRQFRTIQIVKVQMVPCLI